MNKLIIVEPGVGKRKACTDYRVSTMFRFALNTNIENMSLSSGLRSVLSQNSFGPLFNHYRSICLVQDVVQLEEIESKPLEAVVINLTRPCHLTIQSCTSATR